MPVAFVTGSAGFLGATFAAALLDRGYEVRGLDLAPPSRELGDSHDQHVGRYLHVTGDVTRPASWRDALDGADLVVHTAAIVAEGGDAEAFWRVNVGGTSAVMEAAEAAGTPRVVHLSSVVVYGDGSPAGRTEVEPVRMTGNLYTDTKVSSEHAALRIAARGRLRLTVVRPGDVYGPRSSPWTVRPVQLIAKRLMALPKSGRGILHPIYVDDLVEGSMVAAEHEAAVGEVFNIVGPQTVTTREFFAHYARALGVPLPALPTPVARGLAHAVVGAHRAAGRDAGFTPAIVEHVTRSGGFSSAKAAEVLGWRAPTTLDAGMTRTLAWLRAEGLVPA